MNPVKIPNFIYPTSLLFLFRWIIPVVLISVLKLLFIQSDLPYSDFPVRNYLQFIAYHVCHMPLLPRDVQPTSSAT